MPDPIASRSEALQAQQDWLFRRQTNYRRGSSLACRWTPPTIARDDVTEKAITSRHQTDQRSAFLDTAREAARAGQPDKMIEALTLSGFTAGLLRRFETAWPHMPRTEIEEHIARAVDDAYAALSAGRRVTNLTAWIFKASHNKVHDHWQSEFSQRERDPTVIDGVTAPGTLSDDERAAKDRMAEHRRREAIRITRDLLPRIGQGQVVDVMTIVIDAVEAEVSDLSSADIADALRISTDSARALLSRGFGRLERAARDAGIELPAPLPRTAGDVIQAEEYQEKEV